VSSAIEGLKPALLWKYFAAISKIPRGSKNEAAITKYVLGVAKQLGLEARADKFGNVVARKPASSGRERVRTVVLQGHLDMVCEKNKDTVHDFLKDPIVLVRKGDIMMADGTTLGADNGVAVATSLAIMEDKSLVHGPLEFLFTVDEETGLTGANNLGPDFLIGKTLLNLDSEEEGALYVGCSGAATRASRSTRTAATRSSSWRARCSRCRSWACEWPRSRAVTSTTPSRARPRRWCSCRRRSGRSRLSWWRSARRRCGPSSAAPTPV
jgi:Xaa-His dipeptidase